MKFSFVAAAAAVIASVAAAPASQVQSRGIFGGKATWYAADKSEVETKLSALKQALTGTDTAAIKAATEELTQAFYKVSEKLYQAAGGAQGAGFDPSQAGGANPGAGAQGGQDYYDADYTVVDDDKK